MLNRALLTLGLALTLTACADKDSDDDSGGGGGGESAEDGAEVFAAKCSVCHGSDGGGTATAPDLNEKVPALTDSALRDVLENGTGDMADPGLSSAEASAAFDYVRDQFGEEGGG